MVFCINTKSKGISGQIFCFISSFLRNRQFQVFWMGSLHKNLQLMLELLKAPFLVLHFSYYTLITFLRILSVIFLSMLMIPQCGQASDLWQQLELASELESGLRDTGLQQEVAC